MFVVTFNHTLTVLLQVGKAIVHDCRAKMDAHRVFYYAFPGVWGWEDKEKPMVHVMLYN